MKTTPKKREPVWTWGWGTSHWQIHLYDPKGREVGRMGNYELGPKMTAAQLEIAAKSACRALNAAERKGKR